MKIKFVDLAAQNAEIARARGTRIRPRFIATTAYVGGPQVAAFEARVRRVPGRAPRGRRWQRHRRAAPGAARARHRSRRRSDHRADDFHRHRGGDRAGRRAAGVRRRRSGDRQHLSAQALAAIWKRASSDAHQRPARDRSGPSLRASGADARNSGRSRATYGLRIWSKTPARRTARRVPTGSRMESRRERSATAGCFSFYPGKNLGAWGEAGRSRPTTTTLADAGAASARPRPHLALRSPAHTATTRGWTRCRRRCCAPSSSGWRTGTRAGAKSRRATASCCAPADLGLPVEPEGSESCYHLFVIRSPRRDAIRQALLEAEASNAEFTIRVPLHLQPACRALGYQPGDFPVSETMRRHRCCRCRCIRI